MNHSKQRDIIMEYLMSTKSHPTAEEVYNHVRINQPNISLGTVYRNLNQLAENQMILRLQMDDGSQHFDADISEHYHFLCRECGHVSDLDFSLPSSIKKLVKNADNSFNGKIDNAIIYFTGVCSKCSPDI